MQPERTSRIRKVVRTITPLWFRKAVGAVVVRTAYAGIKLIAPYVGLAIICLTAIGQRHKPRREQPAIFWGVEPLINIKFHSRAISLRGYLSKTVVRDVYYINKRTDFDYLTMDIIDQSALMKFLPSYLKAPIVDYWVFVWALRHFDIFNFYFNSTILRYTPWKNIEFQLLKFAKKKTVVTAYGGDVQVASRFRGLLQKHAHNMDYPAHVLQERNILADVMYCTQHADYMIAGIEWVDHMPRWNKLISAHFAIDTEEWKPRPESAPTASQRPVKVLHAPNHRELKGTRFLLKACEELKAEGLAIELVVAEKVTNARVEELLRECDIVADQFIMGWYALFAIEGMSMQKPVMAYLRPDLLELYSLFSFASECPVVNTPPTRIKEVLRSLAEDPALRADLGKRGRDYVLNHHSLESIGKMFDEIFCVLWNSSSPTSAAALSEKGLSQISEPTKSVNVLKR